MKKSITVIPATKNKFTSIPTTSVTKRKVAVYARVSTDSDEQFTSYEAQIDYYTKFINRREDWLFVKVYTDEHAIIGTSGENLVKSRVSAIVPINFFVKGKYNFI